MRGLKAIGLGAALLWSGMAQAAVVDFALTGGYAANWRIDTATPPFSSDASGFTYSQVMGTFPGARSLGVDIDFLASLSGGGLRLTDAEEGTIFTWAGGSQLFDGATSAPSFRLGTFSLLDRNGNAATLSISDPAAAAIPEPASWAMMMIGFAASGMAVRRRTVRVRLAA
jgi:hypothetical protein